MIKHQPSSAGPASGEKTQSPSILGLVAAVLLCYFVLLGGTPTAELNPTLRLLGGVIGGALLLNYLKQGPDIADWLDRRLLVGLLAFATAAVLSAFPRQSLDALLSATALVAATFAARGSLARPRTRRLLIASAQMLSLALTVVGAIAWILPVFEWYAIAGGVAPPLRGLNYTGVLWGYRYDLALLLAILYPSWWIGPRTRLRTAMAILVGSAGALLILLVGSRTIWLAMVAGAAIGALPALRLRTRSSHIRLIVIGGGVIALALLVTGTGGALIERLLSLETFRARGEMWRSLTMAWLERPIQGWGPGSFPWVLQTTNYFDTNTWAPRHPDTVVFQLLPEVGLLGIFAVGLVLSTIPAVWRSSTPPVRSALAIFAISSIGTNPTEFLFILAVAIAWFSYGLPRGQQNRVVRRADRRWIRRIAYPALSGLIALSFLSICVAHYSYSAAQAAAEAGDLRGARNDLDRTIALDPGMALYWRQRGIAEHLLGNSTAALADLEIAVELNRWDDLAWRSMAIATASSRDFSRATRSIEAALMSQRSDINNLLVAALLYQKTDQREKAQSVLTEVVQGWPTITGAAGWDDFHVGISTSQLIDAAAERWARLDPSPNPLDDQLLWFSALSDQPDLPLKGRGISEQLARAYVAALRCEPDARRLLTHAQPSDLRRAEYWFVRLRIAANEGQPDDTARRMLDLLVGESPSTQDDMINPLDEGNWWGYRRQPIFWPTDGSLPDPRAGAIRWRDSPARAALDAGLMGRLLDCS